MPLITSESRSEFADKAKPVRDKIDVTLKKEKNMLDLMKRDTGGVEYKKLLLCEDMIYVATLYISINSFSVEILGTKNNDALNDARKSIYKAIIYLEEIVSNVVDCPYSEIEPKIALISNMPLEKRFYLVRKLGLVIQVLVDAFGDNSKWKWSFVELRGRFAVVAKNLLDMKQAAKDYFDLRSLDYENTVLYIRLLKKLLDKSASEYRDRYELSTRRIDDMRVAINFLIALRRIAMILGDNAESEGIKKKAIVWKSKMENDTKTGASR
ncbi:MAG: hypothetical protein SO116_06975 [Treponema sp.]|nr:hypothetical protein [Spirochaetia bacterium]MDD7015157.1 hypothetical protein [Spirochaetales bacterium]MDY4902599.1 hypothetical protein [Treponema sp.]